MLSPIYSAMGWILKQLYEMLDAIGVGSFALAIIVFTVLINVVFLPININQQKTTAKQTAIRPKLDALKEKCGDDRQKYSIEMQELYQRENVKMMGGCLPQLIRLPFLWGVWQAIRSPLSYIINVDDALIEKGKNAVLALEEFAGKKLAQVTELDVIHYFNDIKSTAGLDALEDAVKSIDFSLFGVIDLTKTPEFTFRFSSLTGGELLLWLIPIFSFATAMLSSVVMMNMQKKTNPDAASMGCMMYMMPVLSLVIAFGVPAAVGFYWACSNVVTMLISVAMNKFLGPYVIIAKDEAKLIKERKQKEKSLEAKL